mmetsp:Transcript_46450/g.92213  ORF Transcript_46450/g.92213 Transcript_46450/m.92213 type:complete len:197 (-) Transcript_46450:68-658(-)
MKLVLQRVTRASVVVEGQSVGSIGPGLVVLFGVQHGDTVSQAQKLARQLTGLRLWPSAEDPTKQWAASVLDREFQLLVVSQFTLFATFKKPKPNFNRAMGGDEAKALYEIFVEECRSHIGGERVATGVFGAMMQVDLCNDGPVTVELVADPPASDAAGAAAPSPDAGGQGATASSPETGGQGAVAAAEQPGGTMAE